MTISLDTLKEDPDHAVLIWLGIHHVVAIDTTGRLGDLKVRMLGATLPPSPDLADVLAHLAHIPQQTTIPE